MSAKKNSRLSRAVSPRRAVQPTAAKEVSLDPLATQSLADATMLLALAAPAVRAPSLAVKSALLARIRATNAAGSAGAASRPQAADATVGWRFEKMADAEGWVKLPFPGLRMREVTVDAARDTALLFVEMAPGAIFPDHDHSTTERGVVLTGDLRMGERLLHAGDFYEAAAGTRHERIASPSGCTGLLWVGAKAWNRWRDLALAR